MKNLLKLSCIFFLAGILFSSCGSKMTLTKRHYTKGYYFAHQKSPHAIPNAATAAKVSANKNNVTKPTTTKVIAENNTTTTKDKQLTASITDKQAVSVKTKKQSQVSPQALKPTFTIKDLDLTSSVAKIRQAWVQSNKNSSGRSDGDGLSLFWILIVVLLILWALGYFAGGGTGGLINLLLLIALILFILWLLRVI